MFQIMLQIEQLEQEVAELQQSLSDAKEGERAMIQVSFSSLQFNWTKVLAIQLSCYTFCGIFVRF